MAVALIIGMKMGEAKRRAEAVKQQMLRYADEWSFLPSDEEANVVAAIEKLSDVQVSRVSKSQLEYMRMKPNQCHENCRFIEKNDPEGTSHHLYGWVTNGEIFTFHSIIEKNGSFFLYDTNASRESS